MHSNALSLKSKSLDKENRELMNYLAFSSVQLKNTTAESLMKIADLWTILVLWMSGCGNYSENKRRASLEKNWRTTDDKWSATTGGDSEDSTSEDESSAGQWLESLLALKVARVKGPNLFPSGRNRGQSHERSLLSLPVPFSPGDRKSKLPGKVYTISMCTSAGSYAHDLFPRDFNAYTRFEGIQWLLSFSSQSLEVLSGLQWLSGLLLHPELRIIG